MRCLCVAEDPTSKFIFIYWFSLELLKWFHLIWIPSSIVFTVEHKRTAVLFYVFVQDRTNTGMGNQLKIKCSIHCGKFIFHHRNKNYSYLHLNCLHWKISSWIDMILCLTFQFLVKRERACVHVKVLTGWWMSYATYCFAHLSETTSHTYLNLWERMIFAVTWKSNLYKMLIIQLTARTNAYYFNWKYYCKRAMENEKMTCTVNTENRIFHRNGIEDQKRVFCTQFIEFRFRDPVPVTWITWIESVKHSKLSKQSFIWQMHKMQK